MASTNPAEQIPVPKELNEKNYPFLMQCAITAIVRNKASNEERVTLDVVFPLSADAVSVPWYVLRNHLAPAYLNKKLGAQGTGWVKIYECKILQVVNRTNPNDISKIPMRIMTFDQLAQYVERWDLNIDVREFHAISIARQFVQLKEEDPTAYEKHVEEYRETRKASYPEVDKYRTDAGVLAEDLSDEFNAITTNTPAISKPSTTTGKGKQSGKQTGNKINPLQKAVASMPVADVIPESKISSPFTGV